MSEAVELQEARALFEQAFCADAPGVTRVSYGDGENFAHAQVAQWAHAPSGGGARRCGKSIRHAPGRDRSQPR